MLAAQKQFAVDVLQDLTSCRNCLFPSGTLVRKLLADTIDLKAFMIDVKKVTGHFATSG